MEKLNKNINNLKPQNSFELTDEGVEASFLELIKRAENDESLYGFIPNFKETYPDAKTYLVGGSVRDAVLGIKSNDYDVMVEGASKNQIEKFFEDYGKIIDTSDTSLGTYKFLPKYGHEPIDVVLPRTETYNTPSRKPTVDTDGIDIIEDLSRRDFTCNAIALEIFSDSGELNYVDPNNGLDDIKNRIIRSVGEPSDRFSDDPLRILRAIRLSCTLGFEIEEKLLDAMHEMSDTINQTYLGENGADKRRVAYERIEKEIRKGFDADPLKFIEILDATDSLKNVFPEVYRLKGLEQPKEYHSEGDAFEHTKLVIKNLPENSSLGLKLAALFHDVGKYDTYKNNNGKITFYGHELFSKQETKQALVRLRFKTELIDEVVWLVENHMKMHKFVEMKPAKQKELLNSPYFENLILLAQADDNSSLSLSGKNTRDYAKEVKEVVEVLEQSVCGCKYVEIIDGRDVTQEIVSCFGDKFDHKKHGKIIGDIKKLTNDFCNNNNIHNKAEALAYAKILLSNFTF